METMNIVCANDVGLHARPASQFVKTAAHFKSKIQVRNLTKDNAFVDAKSILRVLTLGVEKDQVIEISADGLDEKDALQALADLVRSGFNPAA
jgi:phosphocarrier protein HPr